MSTLAFIGLGVMGSPMAVNLHRSGSFAVVGYNRSQGKDADLLEAGGTSAGSIAEAVASADVVAVMVPDTPDVIDVLAGPGGVFASAEPGTLVIDFSSIRPDATLELADRAKSLDIRLLDAPVSGGEPGAKSAGLSVMVGGATDDVAAAHDVFAAVGRTIVHVGPAGSGQTVKAANQLMVAGHIALLSEAIVFLEASGVDTNAALEVLGGGLAGSAVLEQKAEKMLSRSFDPGFRIDLHHKDLGILTSALQEAEVVAPVGVLVAQLMACARANGDGSLDHAALFRTVAGLSGQSR